MTASHPPLPGMTLASAFATTAHALRAGRVRVAVAAVDDWLEWQGDAWALLDVHEHARASRQRLSHERAERALAYALHRLFLADALECEPARVPLYRDASGCPRLDGNVVWTSLSHAGGLLAFAVGSAGPVGVDIEPLSRCGAMDEIAGSVCHADEWTSMASLPASSRAAALLELWVRKEAVLKAAGVGLDVPMTSFVAPRSATVQVPGFEACWRVSPVDAGPGAIAAVAMADGMKIEHVRLRPRHASAVPARSVAAS
jgi:4'-phosphopantetheinyl transferase